jgi:hypothetical protein
VKPRKGSPLKYRGEPFGTVVRVENNLCYFDRADGDIAPFIWRFSEGLNPLFNWEGKENDDDS